MKNRILCSSWVLLVFLALASPVFAADQASECVVLAEKAVEFVREKGKEYAVKVFSASKGPFIERELYVFACSMENQLLAHPYKKELIGQDVAELKDTRGKLLFEEFKKTAEQRGAGWVEYLWPKPGEQGEHSKLSFIKAVPGQNMYVGVGYYK